MKTYKEETQKEKEKYKRYDKMVELSQFDEHRKKIQEKQKEVEETKKTDYYWLTD